MSPACCNACMELVSNDNIPTQTGREASVTEKRYATRPTAWVDDLAGRGTRFYGFGLRKENTSAS